MHVQVTPGADVVQTHATELALGMHNAYVNSFAPSLGLQWQILETAVTLYGSNELVFEAIESSPTAGQDSGLSTPANCALVVSWKSSAHYRGGHPRTYLCGIVQDRLADSRSWTAQTIADFDAAGTYFRNYVNAIGLAGSHGVTFGFLNVYQPKGSTVKPPLYRDPPVFHAITGHAVHPRADSQRRRLGREAAA
jgi:hypothetical protein